MGTGRMNTRDLKEKKKKEKKEKKRGRKRTSGDTSTLPQFSRDQGNFTRPHQLIAFVLRMAKMAYNRVPQETFPRSGGGSKLLNDRIQPQ